jgi:hypothetical protein
MAEVVSTGISSLALVAAGAAMVLASLLEAPSSGLELVLGSMLAPKVTSSISNNLKVEAATLVSR